MFGNHSFSLRSTMASASLTNRNSELTISVISAVPALKCNNCTSIDKERPYCMSSDIQQVECGGLFTHCIRIIMKKPACKHTLFSKNLSFQPCLMGVRAILTKCHLQTCIEGHELSIFLSIIFHFFHVHGFHSFKDVMLLSWYYVLLLAGSCTATAQRLTPRSIPSTATQGNTSRGHGHK